MSKEKVVYKKRTKIATSVGVTLMLVLLLLQLF
ncbi:hypothetical protein LVIS_1318 [Levilactobacillus brevis ATCC 367]|uniref:Uncharacterized protein n=1 Tax=Levilactobacillus brevis (strain ATCC 367 / BCRC 12310 / CIP 105137 / JCM 1170 / LMG 11437 / NCIMB 947 / NCTC 947) TaxID=387344 RepID=Q03QV2_LEVBA|nr:hypothetical protein LVIS_1318 [Levilactobacillus brevis ATCC 367]